MSDPRFTFDGSMTIKGPSIPMSLHIGNGKELLFTIEPDGTIVRGPGFTTIDEMSLKFWEVIEQVRPSSR